LGSKFWEVAMNEDPQRVVVVYQSAHLGGGRVGIEALILGVLSGWALWSHVHPVAGIVGGVVVLGVYFGLCTIHSLRYFTIIVPSVAWAYGAVFLSKAMGGDMVWHIFGAALAFGISAGLHSYAVRSA